jgi:quercetin dioxygenase-like cupin family protein
MKHWNLRTVDRPAGTGPQVLFSTPEVRGVIVELAPGEAMGEHGVRERAVISVVAGSAELTAGDETIACPEGTLILFEPGERHGVRALEQVRLLLLLAPWPAPDHYEAGEGEDPHELPAHATRPPD